MAYVDFTSLQKLLTQTSDYGALVTEYGYSEELCKITQNIETVLKSALSEVKPLAENDVLADEPNDYPSIRKLCEGGNMVVTDIPDLQERMAGAVLGRFAGCTLGVPVEMWSIERMQKLAEFCNMDFPPEDYWTVVDRPWDVQYGVDQRVKYTRDGMDGVPVDDDVTYTILGLLIIERYGFDFTTEQVGEIWKELLPIACTAEEVALRNLKAGIPAIKVGEVDNPFVQWIGADIRADGFGFAAAGKPELAASMGYRDAYLSHRRNGIYGEMFFAAAIAAAFTVDDPVEAIKIALGEIPSTCALYHDVKWALEIGHKINDYI